MPFIFLHLGAHFILIEDIVQSHNQFWSGGIEAAVSLTFDDALDSQLDNALPNLDRHNLKGTFYVNPGHHPEWTMQIPRWQQAAADGHEIGNHTTRHPCSCNFAFSADFCLEKLNLEDIANTIDEAENLLDLVIPQQRGRRTFGYPCYQSHVGSGMHRQSYVPLVAERFLVGRGGGERTNDPLLIDLSYTWAQDVRGYSGNDLIDYVNRALTQGNWAILCMHGVGAEHLAIETQAFAELTDYLASNRERLWTDTVFNIGSHIKNNTQPIAQQ